MATNYNHLHKKYLRGSVLHFTMSDEDVSGSLTTQIAERDKHYTNLLKNHISLTNARGICKEIHKWLFFWILMIACCFGLFYIHKIFQVILSANDITLIINSIPVIITALISLISTIIAVPITITKFLFNTKEDDNITTLIKHTQEHDASGINLFKERLLPKNKAPMMPVDSDDK